MGICQRQDAITLITGNTLNLQTLRIKETLSVELCIGDRDDQAVFTIEKENIFKQGTKPVLYGFHF